MKKICYAVIILFFTLSFTIEVFGQQNVVNIKISDDVALQIQESTIDGLPFAKDINNMGLHVSEMKRVFPPSARFAERHKLYGLDRWYQLSFDTKVDKTLINSLNSLEGIEIAEQDYQMVLYDDVSSIWNLEDSPFNDPLVIDQWYMQNTGQSGGTEGVDIQLFEAWNYSTGSSNVIIKTIDSGVEVNHPDLRDALWVNPEPGSSGYPNDINGWNFFNQNNDINDIQGHGTHVAGTFAAQNNNGIGVAGIAGGDGINNGIQLMTLRLFVGSQSSGAAQTAAAFVYGADNGAVISNNSWGYSSEGNFPAAVKDGIDYFIDNAGFDENGNVVGPMAGGIVIFAAGNSNVEGNYFPAAYERVISVAATNHNDTKSYYSNFAEWVTLSAPGGEIFTTTSIGGIMSTDIESRGLYRFRQGTSMATAVVSGIVGLMVSYRPGLSNEEITDALMNSLVDISEMNMQHEGKIGAGRVNAHNALVELGAPPPVVIPEKFLLDQNYPNPFNNSTNIRFGLTEESTVRIDVYTVLGQRVQTITNTTFPAGTHILPFNGDGLSSGVYIYRMTYNGGSITRKMTLLK